MAKLSVAVQMDPIEKININGDSTFALMLEAQARDHALFYYTPDTLALRNGVVSALVHAVEVRDMEFLRASTKHPVKMTLPGPFTMAKQAQDDFYKDEAAMAMDYADAVNAEIRDLFKAGADIVQIDEPWMAQHPDKAREYGVTALNRALDGVGGTIAVHLCFGYAAVVKDKAREYGFLAELEGSKADQVSIEAAQPDLDLKVLREMSSKTIILGVISLGDMNIETPEIVATRIRKALDHVPPERVVVAPDCGMKYLPRTVALGKLKAMVEGGAER